MDEQVKQPVMIGAIAGCGTIMVYELYYGFTHGIFSPGNPVTMVGMLVGVLIGLVVGAIAGGVAFAVLRNR